MKKLTKKLIEKLIEKLMKIGIAKKITKIKNKVESFIKEAIIPTGNVGIGVSTPKKRGRPKGSKNKVKT